MSFLSNTAKKIVFWNYPRTSWQWDVLCVLILVFIFLTPKSWFQNSEFRRATDGDHCRLKLLAHKQIGALLSGGQESLPARPESQVTASPSDAGTAQEN